MSKYTTEVRFICESLAGYIEQQGYGNVEDILTKAAPLVFDFDFPIFDEDYRLPLERKILRHFYTREISEETVGLWKLKLDAKMNEIMPYYNQLYNSELIEFNPMYDTDLTTKSSTDGTKDSVGTSKSETDTTKNELEKTNYGEITTEDKSVTSATDTTGTENTNYGEKTTLDKEGSSTSVTGETGSNTTTTTGSSNKKEVTDDDIGSTTTESATSTTTANSLDAYSDTPQGSLTGVKNLSYLTNARNVDDSSTTTSSGTTKYTGTDDKTVTTTGSDSESKTSSTSNDGTTETTTDGSENGTKKYNKDVNTTGKENTVTTEDTDGTKKYNKDVNTDTTSNSITNGSTTGNITSTQDYVQYITGKRSLSSFSKYLLEFRETFLNIDNMILEELNDLFFNLW